MGRRRREYGIQAEKWEMVRERGCCREREEGQEVGERMKEGQRE